jgi:hypothetical protein
MDKQTNIRVMKEGQRIQVRVSAIHSHGTRDNDFREKTIGHCEYHSHDGSLDWFTFVGGKTKYRLGGHRDMFSITGPERCLDIKRDS